MVLDLEAGQHVAGDAADPFAHHPIEFTALDPLQQLAQPAVAGDGHAEPRVVIGAALAALVQAEHARLHVPEVGGERLAGRQEQAGLGELSGDRGAGILVVLGGAAAEERRPGRPCAGGGLVAGER